MTHEAGRWGVVEAGHLGGYVPGGDPDTTYPTLWRWFVEKAGAETIVDFGCGDGVAVDFFRSLGADCVGIDGVPQKSQWIYTHDYTTGPFGVSGPVDLGWACEFVEHVEPKFIPNFVADFRQCRWVALTHALPGQAGYHHVNCQPPGYWLGVMEAAGFRVDWGITEVTRALAHGYYTATGMVFENEDL